MDQDTIKEVINRRFVLITHDEDPGAPMLTEVSHYDSTRHALITQYGTIIPINGIRRVDQAITKTLTPTPEYTTVLLYARDPSAPVSNAPIQHHALRR